MSAAPNTQVNSPDLEQERRRIAARLEEIARLSESNVVPATFYGEMLKRLLETLAAPAGDVRARTPQGNLQLQYQINLKEIGLDQNEEWRTSHEELLRQAVSQPRPFHVPPRSSVGVREDGKPQAGNHTNFLLLIAPIVVNQQVAGIIEVWQHANRPPQAIAGYLQYMTYMAELCSRYQRNQIMGQLTGQQQVWTQLEAFARQVHASLNPTEVSYQVANEGRRLVECDRVSVAIRQYGTKARIEAVSGADVVERRSNLVRLMQKLGEQVILWGEKLIFNGVRDDSLPPKVLSALDEYLAESNSKLLVVQPLRDERENGLRPPRSAILMECFEPPAEPQQLIARLDVVARHSTPALYNAVEHRRIPGRWILAAACQASRWRRRQDQGAHRPRRRPGQLPHRPALLGALRAEDGFYRKTRAVGAAHGLRSDRRKGQSVQGRTQHRRQRGNRPCCAGLARPVPEIVGAEHGHRKRQFRDAERGTQLRQFGHRPGRQGPEQGSFEGAESKKEMERRKMREREEFVENNNANPNKLGEYYLRAPSFTAEEKLRVGRREWTVLNGNFSDEWLNKYAKPSDPILKLGAKDGPWEIELRIPQKHISQVMKAYELNGVDVLDVDFLLRSDPTRTYRGLLYRDHISSEAIPNRDEKDESEPEVIAYVTIDDENIDPNYRLGREALTSGTEVRAKVRCGKHALGYSLFYGVWEFLYEKVVFFF